MFSYKLMTKEVFCIQESQDGLTHSRLTYLCWLPKTLTDFKILLHLFGKKARIVGTLRSESLLIHEEIFGSTPDFSISNKPKMARELQNLIKEDQEQEDERELARHSLDLNDRKYKYSKEQLTKFVEFKQNMIKKMGENVCAKLTDNTYARFLDGYQFNLVECEKNMTDYLVFVYN